MILFLYLCGFVEIRAKLMASIYYVVCCGVCGLCVNILPFSFILLDILIFILYIFLFFCLFACLFCFVFDIVIPNAPTIDQCNCNLFLGMWGGESWVWSKASQYFSKLTRWW